MFPPPTPQVCRFYFLNMSQKDYSLWKLQWEQFCPGWLQTESLVVKLWGWGWGSKSDPQVGAEGPGEIFHSFCNLQLSALVFLKGEENEDKSRKR